MHKTFLLALFLVNYTMAADPVCYVILTRQKEGSIIELLDSDGEDRPVKMVVQNEIPNSTERNVLNPFLSAIKEQYQIPGFAQAAFLAYLEGVSNALSVTIKEEGPTG